VLKKNVLTLSQLEKNNTFEVQSSKDIGVSYWGRLFFWLKLNSFIVHTGLNV
jgi:hypothetical protein